MFTFRKIYVFVGLLLAFSVLSQPALAVTQKQWTNVCTNFLGLRSGASQTDVNGAGYGMDNGNTSPMNCLRPAPSNWDTLLVSTLTKIKSFPDSGYGYLLVVNKCPGQSDDYSGTFPKCNRVGGNVVSSMPKTINNYTVDQMVSWVLGTI